MYLSESMVEDAALDWFRKLGYEVVSGGDLAPGPHELRTSYNDVLLLSTVRRALSLLNPGLPADALDDAFRKLTRPQGTTLESRNRDFHRMIVDGITVEYRDDSGVIRGAQARVIDLDKPDANDWLAVKQFTVAENNHRCRADIVLFVNGLPLGLIELKNPADEQQMSGRPGANFRPIRPSCRACSRTMPRSLFRTALTPASAPLPQARSGSSPGAP